MCEHSIDEHFHALPEHHQHMDERLWFGTDVRTAVCTPAAAGGGEGYLAIASTPPNPLVRESAS